MCRSTLSLTCIMKEWSDGVCVYMKFVEIMTNKIRSFCMTGAPFCFLNLDLSQFSR